jgi:cell division septation protein DedD
MQRGIGGTVFEPVQPERRDRELTVGPVLLTLIGFGLFALCGLCFVFGYAVGHRNAEPSAAISVPPPVMPAQLPPANTQSKPSAGQGEAQPQAGGSPAETSEPAETDSNGGGTAARPIATTTQPAAGADGASSESPVRTVVASQRLAQPASAGGDQPALVQSASIMVQIAAVTHPEDADVLVGALRKRGYAVTARRDPSDGLLHVQIGPFANRSDAYAMRQKLLNDGYNAIVQP